MTVLARRYELLSTLGSGGMGTVYRARDTRLERIVAIKRLAVASESARKKLLDEAQLQGRVDHPNVCRIHEAGLDDDGEPYIVMQFVNGDTLADVMDTLTLEQKVAVVRDAAEGVHAANRLGLIHRDVKPHNILVERRDDGTVQPFVTDFGIARDLEKTISGSTGSILGTANYMAPEQARGEIERIGPHTDVYGLGATLYDLLAGVPPFVADNRMAILDRVVREDPAPLPQDVPADLAVIVAKCMEKEPARRYRTARELSDELRRFLEGEPIDAKPVSLATRALKLAQRRRALTAAIATAVCAALALGVIGLRVRARAASRSALAQMFGQDVKEIEGELRYAMVLPQHDTGAEEARVRERMERIAAEMEQLGPDATGPGEYALGRGALVLQQIPEARRRLQAAWDADYREPEVALSLATALALQYRPGHEGLRDEAEALLAAAPVSDESVYVHALLRLAEGRYDEAEKLAGAAAAHATWLYEARELKARVHVARAAGLPPGLAMREYAMAETNLRQAIDVARSDARLRRELCDVLGAQARIRHAPPACTVEARAASR